MSYALVAGHPLHVNNYFHSYIHETITNTFFVYTTKLYTKIVQLSLHTLYRRVQVQFGRNSCFLPH